MLASLWGSWFCHTLCCLKPQDLSRTLRTSCTSFSGVFSPWMSIRTPWAAFSCLGPTRKSWPHGSKRALGGSRALLRLITWRAFNTLARVLGAGAYGQHFLDQQVILVCGQFREPPN